MDLAQGTLLSALSDLNGKKILKIGDVCIHVTDSLCSIAKTNTTL